MYMDKLIFSNFNIVYLLLFLGLGQDTYWAERRGKETLRCGHMTNYIHVLQRKCM